MLMNESYIAVLLLSSTLVEGTAQYCKQLFEKKFPKQCILSLILGLSVALLFDWNIFYMFDVTQNFPFFGNVLTGVAISRGSNYVSDLAGLCKKAQL